MGVLMLSELGLGIFDAYKLDKVHISVSEIKVESEKSNLSVAKIKAVQYPAFGVYVPENADAGGVKTAKIDA